MYDVAMLDMYMVAINMGINSKGRKEEEVGEYVDFEGLEFTKLTWICGRLSNNGMVISRKISSGKGLGEVKRENWGEICSFK